jgi:hypothetical protein
MGNYFKMLDKRRVLAPALVDGRDPQPASPDWSPFIHSSMLTTSIRSVAARLGAC